MKGQKTMVKTRANRAPRCQGEVDVLSGTLRWRTAWTTSICVLCACDGRSTVGERDGIEVLVLVNVGHPEGKVMVGGACRAQHGGGVNVDAVYATSAAYRQTARHAIEKTGDPEDSEGRSSTRGRYRRKPVCIEERTYAGKIENGICAGVDHSPKWTEHVCG